MWKFISLRARIFLLLGALIITSLIGGLVTIWHIGATDDLLISLIDKNMASFQAAEGLEIALLRQKGYLTYYFLDGNQEWLSQLKQDNKRFLDWLARASGSATNPVMTNILDKIAAKYRDYSAAREEVIKLYQAGRREEGAKRHWAIRHQFLEIYDLCDNYKLINQGMISQIRNESLRRAAFIKTLALAVLPSVLLLGLLLAYILTAQLLTPIRQLSLETGAGAAPEARDEVQALSRRVHDLIENVDQAQSKLERSQEHLLQTEKMAMVGKLAAGVAHSIRNPLTSVKMRLFSLGRTLDLAPPQQEDFEVISEEIRHIDTIVANFLEYSRPPKLTMQKISPSVVVDMALQLLRHRLESYNVEVKVKRFRPLPEVWADPDQLKEVLVNLLTNACEAMGSRGGSIIIQEGETFLQSVGQVVAIQVRDNGPGIPESIQDKVFQPFFSTKEEGTGLGLSIAARILAEHGGWLDLESQEGQGTTFTINLPYRKIKYGSHPDS